VSYVSSSTISTPPPPAIAERPRSRQKTRPLSGWGPTILRLAFGVVWGINAALKWMPGYRSSYLSQLKAVAQGQPSFLHGWFHFWITLQSGTPSVWADLTGVTETALALVLLLGVARRPGYLVGAGYMLLVWAVGQGFGGPYVSGSTDVGTGIIYTLLFLTMFIYAAPARTERFSVDRLLVARHPGWRRVADLSSKRAETAAAESR
jgi:thiosulfate dehydrogenase (quinone) large subunit